MIVGHLAVRERLLGRAGADGPGGSLLLTGPDGVGKRRVAMELAQRELCFARSACGQCAGCRPFRQSPLPVELPNLLRIAPEGKAGLIRISAIREDDLVEGGVIQWVHQAPPPGCHRWILVEDAHRLNGASANMLLKTLEEPPPGAHFLLVTHRPEAMLPTIRSRCERVSFGLLGDEEVWAVAAGAGWEAADKARWTALSAGTLRYLEPAAFARAVAQVEAWLGLARGGTFAKAGESLLPEKNNALAQSEQLVQCLELLLLVLADVARLREGRPVRLEPWRGSVEGLARSALQLRKAMELAMGALRHLGRNPFADTLLREVALALVAG